MSESTRPAADAAADTALAPTGPEESRPVAGLVLPLDTPPISVETEVDSAGLQALLAHTEETWNRLGLEEPHWSVISAECFKQATVEAFKDEFFASGAGNVATFIAFLARNGVDPARFKRVLEYGCGLGRVTRHLAERFPEVVGCDISPSHLRQAGQYLQDCGLKNVELQRIRSIADVDGPIDLDAIVCLIVLQHNPPPAMAAILEKLLRRLRPGGVAYFQVPTHAVGYGFKVDEYLAHGIGSDHIEMHYLPQRRIFQIARDAGCDVLEVREDDWVGRRQVELSNTFLLQRR
ncbi:MAG: class I SAM-dependent methyltransferase [Chitinophagaceae bacterium]|nr:class I SAM-dependent methyltransferase [Rubrivivax sp.]